MPDLQAAGGTAITEVDHQHWSRLRVLAYAIGVAGLGADQAAKTLALNRLDPANPPVYLGGLVSLQLVRNPGAAFSMGEGFTVVLSCVAIAAFAVVAGWMIPRVARPGWAVAEGLLLAGILGNLTDRLFREPGPLRGHVVDFIAVPYFAIFNVADICITGAAILIVWFVLVRQVGPDGRSFKEGHDTPGPVAPDRS